MPDMISGGGIGPDQYRAFVTGPGAAAAGAKEVMIDSTEARLAYLSAGNQPQIEGHVDAEALPELDVPTSDIPAEAMLPRELIDAMASGKPPPPGLIPHAAAIAAAAAATAPTRAIPLAAPPTAAVELTLPLGPGVVARVSFTAQPTPRHWKKLIRHLEIEAEEETYAAYADSRDGSVIRQPSDDYSDPAAPPGPDAVLPKRRSVRQRQPRSE